MEDNLRKIIYVLVAIFISIIIINFIFWLFPILLVCFLAYYIYRMMTNKKSGKKTKIIEIKENKK